MRRLWFMWGGFVLLALVLFAACKSPSSQHVAKIVVALPLQQSEVAQAMKNAVHLMEEETQGYAGEHQVEFVYLDSSALEGIASSVDAEMKTAQQAIDDPAVVAYIGCTSSARAKAAIPLLNQAEIVTLSPAATWPGLTKPGFSPGAPGIFYPSGIRTFFRVAPADDMQGAVAARWAAQLGVKQVYIVDDEDLYGQGIAGVFEVTARDVGLEVIAHSNFNGAELSETEIDDLAEQVVATHPDLVFLGGSRAYGGGAMLAALRKRDPEIKVMVPDGMVHTHLLQEYAPEVTEGVYGTGITLPAEQLPSQKAAQFVADFREAYGAVPPAFAVNTYECAGVVLKAIAQSPSPVTRAGVLKAMGNLGTYSGVLGNWSFTDTGDMDPALCSGWQVQNGTWEFVKVLK